MKGRKLEGKKGEGKEEESYGVSTNVNTSGRKEENIW